MVTTYCGILTLHTLSQKLLHKKSKGAESGSLIRLEHPLSGHTVTQFTLIRYWFWPNHIL